MSLPIDKFTVGIEHEFPVRDSKRTFCDFSNTTYEELAPIIEALPYVDTDYPGLRVGDMRIKLKRWYIEGFERFSETGEFSHMVPKGFEIRTPLCNSLTEAVQTLTRDFTRWESVADTYGYTALRVSYNPFQTSYSPDPPLNTWEREHQQTPEERTEHMHMLTYGPDMSFSHPDLSVADVIDIGQKLTYYSPYIVPFSFSSPFYNGEFWQGLSRRTYYRTGKRPATRVFLADKSDLLHTAPTLTEHARIPAEVGRIEFKAFDLVSDIRMYQGLGTLLLGLIRDTTLPGRRVTPDAKLHQHVARYGFSDDAVYEKTQHVLQAARAALPKSFHTDLDPLVEYLQTRTTPAHACIEKYRTHGDIAQAI